MPDVLPSCFGDHGSHNADTTGARSAQNSVTCMYRTKLAGEYCLISITWCKSLMGQGLSVSVDYPTCQLTCNVDMKPWLFWKKQGCKSLLLGDKKVDVCWDLSSAKYTCGPEPQEGFFVAVVCDHEVALLLGDMHREALKKLHAGSVIAEAALLSRKEHVFGKQLYTTKAQFSESGRVHDIAIECHAGNEREPRLYVKVDKQLVIQVKRLMWKFRGNQTILIDGIPIEVFWDVHNWFFNSNDGHAVFMFQACVANEKPWLREYGIAASGVLQGHVSHSFTHSGRRHLFPDGSCPSVLQWPSSHSFKESEPSHGLAGFSLLLYAWRNE